MSVYNFFPSLLTPYAYLLHIKPILLTAANTYIYAYTLTHTYTGALIPHAKTRNNDRYP